ncbi:hypothetical protein CIHG_08167 [Coccidioides immitis H538.4]|uniref:Uncharacterized protein n=3 Tax=Coccidioides immitis TaxID=5501 RepID=A0A0J8U4Y7_COCIT|nr:hypothetical protein CIRG_04238 [Coccidioides immitis RMSCC 2394]KMU81972.1 hypothetical protein CISG_09433 [Coccidioides immitis RMSCC 3703]KMU90357.1 hypothetical protein CIHG_08167 [Coccidioides immitis H538.4]
MSHLSHIFKKARASLKIIQNGLGGLHIDKPTRWLRCAVDLIWPGYGYNRNETFSNSDVLPIYRAGPALILDARKELRNGVSAEARAWPEAAVLFSFLLAWTSGHPGVRLKWEDAMALL